MQDENTLSKPGASDKPEAKPREEKASHTNSKKAASLKTSRLAKKKPQKITPRILSGFNDRFGASFALKEELLDRLRAVFKSYGFSGLETPSIEYLETLIGNSSEEIKTELFTWHDAGNRAIALRFDMTVPLARFLGMHRFDVVLPYRRYAIGSVFRGERAQRGRYKEFTQCDFDIVDISANLAHDAEICAMIGSIVEALNLKATIYINNRALLNALLDELGIADKVVALRLVDKLDKVEASALCTEASALGIENFGALLELLDFKAPFKTFASQLEAHFVSKGLVITDVIKEEINTLEVISKMLSNLSDAHFEFSLSIARGLEYYTGLVFETFLDDNKTLGSICSGGRYGGLIGRFSKEELTGVGASVGLDRLLAALRVDATKSEIELMLCPMDDTALLHAMSLAKVLRGKGCRVEVFASSYKLKKALNHASAKGIRYVGIIGSDELANNSITLRDMEASKQSVVPLGEGARGLIALLGR